jgi:hypothetical protein
MRRITRSPMKTRTSDRCRAIFIAMWAASLSPKPASAEPSSEPRPEHGYWGVAEPRWFVSTKSDLGTPYVKPYLSFGYGMPHWIWAGIDANAISTLEMVMGYTGVRLSTPLLDVAFGARDTLSFNKAFLPPRATFTRDEVFDQPGAKARYLAWEGEAVAVLPLPYSGLVFDFVWVRTLDVPQQRYVYDEAYRAIVANPTFMVLRAAAVVRLLREDALKAGVLTEYVFSTGRDKGTLRVGPAAVLQLTDHLQAVGALTGVVSGPDQLGFTLGAYGVAGLRYYWATGESSPKAPWQGPFIP